MTVKAGWAGHARRLLENTFNAFKFDCLLEGRECAEETAGLRADFGELIHAAVRAKHAEAREVLGWRAAQVKWPCMAMVGPSFGGTPASASKVTCYLCQATEGFTAKRRFRPYLPALLNWMEKSSNRTEAEEEVLALVSRMFRLPEEMFFEKLEEMVGGAQTEKDWTFDSCLKGTSNFSFLTLVSAASLVALLRDESTIPFGTFLANHLELLLSHNAAWDDEIMTKIELLPSLLVSQAGMSLGSQKLSLQNIYEYLTPAGHGIPERDLPGTRQCGLILRWSRLLGRDCRPNVHTLRCCKMEERLFASRDLVLKTMKYGLYPAVRTIAASGDVHDFSTLKGIFGYNDTGTKGVYSKPKILGCSTYHRHGNRFSPDCDFRIRNVYTTSGIGHTYNSDRFWNLYERTMSNEHFYKELAKEEESEQNLARILGHGEAFSFNMLVRVNSGEEEEQVVVHSPFEIADMVSTSFTLSPGRTFIISVMPSLMDTDHGGLEMDVKDRRCLSSRDNHGLVAFRRFNRVACLHECHHREARKICNCTPWDQMALDDDGEEGSLCNYAGRRCFIRQLSNALDPATCQCPGSCQDLQYTQTLRVEDTDVLATCGEIFRQANESSKTIFPQIALTYSICSLSLKGPVFRSIVPESVQTRHKLY